MTVAVAQWSATVCGGVIIAVAKLFGCMDRDRERYGESKADKGKWDRGVVNSDIVFRG